MNGCPCCAGQTTGEWADLCDPCAAAAFDRPGAHPDIHPMSDEQKAVLR